MSGVTKEWVALLILVLCFSGFTFGEAVWLNKRNWAGFGKSLLFAGATNSVCLFIGFLVFFVTFAVILAMAWDGSIEKFPLDNYGLASALIFAILFTPVSLALAKRILLPTLKMRAGKPAWLFAAASSFLIWIVSVGLPLLFLYLF